MAANQEVQIQKEVNKLLLKDSRNLDVFTHKVESLAERFGDNLYPAILFTTAHLEFQKKTARKHCRQILEHWMKMTRQIKREVDFRVALLDYFVYINRRIKNPKIIEIKVFQKTQEETYVDELTRLYNYRYFMKALNQEVHRAKRYHSPLSLVIYDVDDFKYYNDTNGHLAGNQALKKLAQIIKKTLRDVDIITRYGGEEFALILPETNKEGAFIISQRIREKVERSSFVKEAKQPLKKFTISGGVATLHVDAKTSNELVQKADQALYISKSRGKNQVFLYEEECRDTSRVDTTIQGRLTLTSDSGDVIMVKNISASGLLFHYTKAIALGTILYLSLNLPGRKSPIVCKSKVRRVEEIKKNKKYGIGVSYTQIREPEKKALQRFLRSLIRGKK